MPSYRESPGLSTLEALWYGCEVVTSSEAFCPVKYYKFDKYAHLCNPNNIVSIKNAILEAFNTKKNTISKDYFDFFSYENVAKLTLEAYKYK